MKKDNELKLFLLITSVLSIIMILIGTTYSYFNMSARSKLNSIAAEAGKIKLGLTVTGKYTSHKLIPMEDKYIERAYQNKCVDENNRGACLAYDLEVINLSEKASVIGTINFNTTNIENLTYMVLDEDGNIFQDVTHINTSANLSLGPSFSLEQGSEETPVSKTFTLLVWLTDTNEIQDDESNGNFDAVVTYSLADGNKITAQISGM